MFSLSKSNQLYVKRINENDKWRQASVWIVLAMLISGLNYSPDGKNYIYDDNLIYDNHMVFSVNVSPSVENYFGALCNMERIVEKAGLEFLGLNREDTNKIQERIIAENKKQIEMAQRIALNPDLAMRLLEYCQEKGDIKAAEGGLRTYKLYKRFFRNVQYFLEEENLEAVDMSMLWVPTVEAFETGEKIDICKIYAEMHEKQKTVANMQNNNIMERQRIKRNFASKVTDISQSEYLGRIEPIPGSLRNKTAAWAKEKLDSIANYIQKYTYENKKFPIGFESNLLIKIYSDVVDLYAQNPELQISEEQHNTYRRIAQVIRQSSLK